MLRTHTLNKVNESLISKKVVLAGWIDTIRSHGKLLFIDLRDRYGKVQCVIHAKNSHFKIAESLNPEASIQLKGEIQKRPKGTENKELESGNVELGIEEITIFNNCPVLPYELSDKTVSDEVKMKYRFLDLRSKEMQRNLELRHKIIKSFRDFFDKSGFFEIETPFLGKSTPEGARDYIVPSRNMPGKFYALPQSPQLYKQLLMVAGYDKYFQIARCMRDEDLRADRQPEFTQVDAEMSFVEQEDVFDMVERSLQYVLKDVFNVNIKIPFQKLTYDEAMKKYNSDKPDLRKNKEDANELAFGWVIDFPLFEYSEEEKKYVAAHHPFCMPNDLNLFEKEPLKVKGKTYDLVLNGTEILSGSIRVHVPGIQREIFKLLKLDEKEIEEKFGFMLNAFSYGAPPHGGFAIGLDRLVQILVKAPSIREVIAFPKNREAKDIMLDTPCSVSERQLKDVHIGLLKENNPNKKEVKKPKVVKKKK